MAKGAIIKYYTHANTALGAIIEFYTLQAPRVAG